MTTIRDLLRLAGTIAFLAVSLSPALAGENISSKLAAKKAQHAALTRKTAALGSEVSVLKSKLVDTSRNLRAAEESLSATDTKLQKLKEKKLQYLDRLYKDEEALGGLVTAAQRFHSTSTPDVLLQSSPINAARAVLVMKSMIPMLDQQYALLKSQLMAIEKIENDITDQMADQSKELKNINKQQDDLGRLLKERQTLYRQTDAARKSQEEEVNRLARESRNLEDLVSKIQKTTKVKTASLFRLPPNTLLPVHGTIRTGFGEKDELGAKSKGVTFNVRSNATIVTPLAGKVKFAGSFQKYKQILIIEHQGGYHSLIAGLGRIDTVVGASLAAGEPVGAADASFSDARVYYELRHNGDPVNPQRLLVAQHKQQKG